MNRMFPKIVHQMPVKIIPEDQAVKDFFSKIAAQENATELIPGKLHFSTLEKGQGRTVTENDAPLLLYDAKRFENGQIEPCFELAEPKTIPLRTTLPGFAKGIFGMQAGEKRAIYVHPSIPVIFEVKILALQK